MKKIFKNKKFIIILLIVSFITIGLIILLLKMNFLNLDSNKVLKEETYVAYVKINPLVKLTFNSSYYECKNKEGKTIICSKYTNIVKNVELMNEDAKNIYKEQDYKDKNLIDAIVLLVETANNNKVNIKDIDITTNYNYDIKNINKIVIEKIKENTLIDIEVKFNYEKNIDEESILANEQAKKYLITFDCVGGTSIENQLILENEIAKKPDDPIKEGYKFMEWQFDGKTYNFDTLVTKDITLTALWQKVENPNLSNNQNNSVIENNNMSQDSSINSCTPKKFTNKYSYVYETESECIHEGNNAFFEVSDKIDNSIFTYDCEKVVDDCGKEWYGVYYNRWAGTGDDVIKLYY